MKTVYNFGKTPIFAWVQYMEQDALEQARQVSLLPFIFKHVAIMPDVHTGYGVPIGCVFCTKDVIIPNAVGVDIGCGMISIKLNIEKDLLVSKMPEIVKSIKDKVCRNRHDSPVAPFLYDIPSEIIRNNTDNLQCQIGTLGGGNHFIEFQESKKSEVWLTVHSGSRNIGNVVARHHHGIAEKQCKEWHINVLKDLSYLPISSIEGKNYIHDMEYCIDYASHNRILITEIILHILNKIFEIPIKIIDSVECCHNFARMENHYGENVITHRKGATSAREGEYGIIPGSQGTKSYIVCGLGNRESFFSCSHGAGRVLSRKNAKETLDLDEQKNILDQQGIFHTMNSASDLDEAPGAYKDIEEVMENQKHLVEITEELTPFAVIKN